MNVVLGVSGSVAAYRAADLARELMRAGFTVRVCLTDAAQNFVSAALFEVLTGQPCLTDTFEEPVTGRMAHIDWARQADVVVVAPATANTLNKLNAGIGDDMLTTIMLVTTKPLVVAPAMNPQMYVNEHTQASLQGLRARGAVIVEPMEGDVACGENGQGKLASIPQIVAAVQEAMVSSTRLKGKKILITSGPTQEAIDSVRYISNRSSGKMGAALAKAALKLGAEVTVIAGPQKEPIPPGVHLINVTTAQEMHDAAVEITKDFDVIIGAAAVADYRIANPVKGKIRREFSTMSLELVANQDIIGAISHIKRPDTLLIGFAAEPDAGMESGHAKLKRKGLQAIAVNNVSQSGIGFDADSNALTMIFDDGRTVESGIQSKFGCAMWLFDQVFPN